MISSYGEALSRIKPTLSNQQLDDYSVWNWLVHKLNYFIWCIVGRNKSDEKWEDTNEGNIYRLWLNQVVNALGKSYNDATPTIAFKCASNCPAEEVAKIKYNATPLVIKNAFFDNLNSDDYKNYQEQNNDSDG